MNVVGEMAAQAFVIPAGKVVTAIGALSDDSRAGAVPARAMGFMLRQEYGRSAVRGDEAIF